MQARTILVVDDEEPVRITLHRVLESAGYSVLLADSGEEALRILQEKPVQLLISDQNMPGLSGIELLKLVGVRHPHVLRIMLTADTDPETAVRSINEGEVYRFIRKPWNNSDLRTIVHFAFRVARLEEEKRRLIALVREQQKSWKDGKSLSDPADLEAELLLLAEDEVRES
jgi:two-component system probable response regulator PhcQ